MKISQCLLQETFMSDCVSIIWVELGNHFSVTCIGHSNNFSATRIGHSNHFSVTRIGHSNHFSVTRIGHDDQISVTTIRRMMKKSLNFRMKTRFVKIGTMILILSIFYTIWVKNISSETITLMCANQVLHHHKCFVLDFYVASLSVYVQISACGYRIT